MMSLLEKLKGRLPLALFKDVCGRHRILIKGILKGTLGLVLVGGLLLYLATPPSDQPTLRIVQKLDGPKPAPAAAPQPVAETLTPPMQRHAHVLTLSKQAPRLAIVITDIHMTPDEFQAAFQNIPPTVTLSLPAASPLVPLARSMGYELLMEIPMEPADYPYNDPGANPLLTDLSPEQNAARLDAYFAGDPPFVGVFPLMGESFLQHEASLESFVAWLGKHGYGYVDPTHQTNDRNIMLGELARAYGTHAYINPFVLDEDSSLAEIEHQFSVLEHDGTQGGVSLGILRAYPQSLDQLQKWLSTLAKKDLNLVPFSGIFFPPEVEKATASTPASDPTPALPPTAPTPEEASNLKDAHHDA